ncbi:hypothetical protein ACG5V6_21560 [Streptomyces chitinivorans]|uniref:Uncharacterized protein n=1 Tax=Streptomyces chitinivorans TaxID=1257027 RepID=A0ABW7HYE4_9ACTN
MRKWLLSAALGATALAVAAAAIVHSNRDSEEPEALKANRAQVRKACAGLLPAAHLDPFLPEDTTGRVRQYGALVEPGHESRAFIDCRLVWTDDEGEAALDIHMRAEPWGPGDELPSADEDETLPFPYRLPDGSRGAVVSGSGHAEAYLKASCPKGDFERFRLGTDLKVFVELPVGVHDEDDGNEHEDDEHADGLVEEDLRLTARSALRVADRVREQQACGTAPFGRLRPVPMPASDDGGGYGDDGEAGAEGERSGSPRGKGTCAWLDPAVMGYPKGDWKVSGGSSFDPSVGECRAVLDGFPDENEIKGVEAVSVSGAGARGFYQGDETGLSDQETREHHSPGPGWAAGPEEPEGTAELRPNGSRTLPSLALWAESMCDGGQTFHRVSATPELGYSLDPDGEVMLYVGKGPALSGSARGELSRTARAALDRYLAAPGGWPERAHCRDTTILGEVEEWEEIAD